MKVNTTRFGEVEITEDQIISFDDGILGFESIKKYVIFEMDGGGPLMWMQALEDPNLAFILIRPFEFRPQYSLELSDSDTELLKLEKPEDSDVFSIVVIPEDHSKMTANLQGPIVINLSKNMGRQVISTNQNHKLKHYILEEMEKNLKPEDTKKEGE